VFHGFERTASGTITTFKVKGAGTGNLEGTVAAGINTAGTIAGWYSDPSGAGHGFVRSKTGVITTFDPPDSVSTIVFGINTSGEVNGVYGTSSGDLYVFVRNAEGVITSYELPGSEGLFNGINTAGDVTGYYVDSGSVYHGYLFVP